jgi:hypothetical protein
VDTNTVTRPAYESLPATEFTSARRLLLDDGVRRGLRGMNEIVRAMEEAGTDGAMSLATRTPTFTLTSDADAS